MLLIPDHAVTVEKGGCFPGEARVTTADGSQKTLASLRPGDQVMAMSETGRVVFSPVLLFLHRDERSHATFLVLRTEDGGRLVVTRQHLVFLASRDKHRGRYRARFASRAQKGDYVLIHGAGGRVRPSRIISVSVEEGVGVYAPLTQHGTLFVDGVLASSYAVVEDHAMAHRAFGPLRWLLPFHQLLWGERRGGPESCSEDQPSTLLHGRAGTAGGADATNSTMSVGMDVTEDRSNIHWYARLLYSFGQVFLDSGLFHP